MTDTIIDVAGAESERPADPVDELSVAEQLVAQARVKGINLIGPDGLLTRLTQQVLETALEEEMAEHLGYDKHDAAGRNHGNSRNGVRAKTVLTEIGPVEIDVPRDIDASFQPKIVRKRQRRLGGVDEMVLSLTARGLTTGKISAHLARCMAPRSAERRSPSVWRLRRGDLIPFRLSAYAPADRSPSRYRPASHPVTSFSITPTVERFSRR